MCIRDSIIKECCAVEVPYLEKSGGHLYDNLEDVLSKLSEKYFLGIHGHYATYNVGGLFFNDNMRHNRYQGHLYRILQNHKSRLK